MLQIHHLGTAALNARLTGKAIHPLALILIVLFLHFSNTANAQWSKGHYKPDIIKDKAIIISSCKEDLGDGSFRISFSYTNPNPHVVSLHKEASFVLLKIASPSPRRLESVERIKVLNVFQPGIVENAFSFVIYKNGFAKWTVVNKNWKASKTTGTVKSNRCEIPDPGIIFPVYGQGNGKSETPLGLELTALAEGNAGGEPSELVYQLKGNDKVLVEIIPSEGNLQQVIQLLTATFGLQYSPNAANSDFVIDPAVLMAEEFAAVDVFIPIARLDELNAHADIINFVRPLFPPIRNGGIVTTEGDAAQVTDVVRASFRTEVDGEITEVNGTGISVGVISDSFDKQPFTGKTRATIDVENGDLPGVLNPEGFMTPVRVLKDYPLGVASDEGRAMLQIIHDIAPGASLAFSTGILSPRDMAMAIGNLDAAGYTIITDDITYPLEPFFGTGQIAEAINAFTSKPGRSYLTSAGNFANNGYQNRFLPTASTPITNFLDPGSPAKAHVFNAQNQDYLQQIRVVPGTYMIVLQWEEGVASQENSQGANTDLDIYLVDESGNLIVGNNRDNEAGDPAEVLVFQANGTGEANIMITSANGNPPPGLAFRYIAFRSDGLQFLEYQGGAPTLSGHAMTPAAITVAAVDHRTSQSPVVENFSSYAGLLSNNAVTTIDLSAPDGVNTNVASIGQDIDSDGFPNFFGTSASAPHAAGAFALLFSALPSWYPAGLSDIVPGATTTNNASDEVLRLFQSTAIPAGPVVRGGAGLINAAAAFNRIASQTAHLTGLLIEDGKSPGAEPFEVTILGEFLPEDPTVLLEDEELVIVSNSDTQIKALVGTFTGKPALYVSSPPITPGGSDGGLSNALFFFDGDTRVLNIIADDQTAEFGQEVTFTYSVEGLPEGVTYESLGLPEIVFQTPAVFPYPDANNYVITPGFGNAELTEEQMEAFQINFETAQLTITKKDLLILPLDVTFQYGEAITIPLQYIYDNEGIADNADFLETIKSFHQTDFFPENTLLVINKLRAVVNEQQLLDLLDNGSWMSSERLIQNKLRPIVNGLNVIDLETQNFEDYLNIVTDPATNKLRAVINKLRAVVNGGELLRNNIDLVIENKLRPVINDTGLGDQNDGNDYSSIFAVVDAEDASTDTEQNMISKLYAMNLITGLEVGSGPQNGWQSFPGAFLSPLASNFNITYGSGQLNISPADLDVRTGDLAIRRGDPIDPSLIEIDISGFVYDDTFEKVFPEGVVFKFEDEEGNVYKEGDTGEFLIKIEAPLNYLIVNPQYGKLVVNSVPFDCERILTLDFSRTPLLQSGTSLKKGAVYRFPQVTPDKDALITIVNLVNSVITKLDQNKSDAPYFKPEIRYTTTRAVRNPGVDFKMTLVETGTNIPAQATELVASFIDIDGNNNYREQNRVDLPERYTAEELKEISVSTDIGRLIFLGGNTEYDGISNANTRVNISTGFVNTSVINFRFGITATGSQNAQTQARQSGIQFSCLDNFIDPVTTLQGDEHVVGSESESGVVFPNPVTDLLNIHPEVQASFKIDIFDIYGILIYTKQYRSDTVRPVQVAMSSYAEGIYFVRISSGTAVTVYTVLRDN